MAKYVLGENGARKFKQLTTSKIKTSNRIAHSGQHGIDNYYASPFQVQWAQSSGEQNTDGTYNGTYIIWLPNGFLRVNNIFKEKIKSNPAENYNTQENGYGWFDLKSMLDEDDSPYTEWPNEFSIWLDYSGETVSFHFNDSYINELSRRILIARVINYNIIQVINSSLAISDANMPFDIVKINYESEPNKPVLKLVRNWFYDANHDYTQLSDVEIPLLSGSLMNAYLVNKLTINDEEGKISSNYSIQFTKDLSSVPEVSAAQDEKLRNFLYWKKLWSYSGDDGSILYDYRNAVVEMNWTGIDNNTVSYGDDGQYRNFLHLANFYNKNAEVDSLSTGDRVLVRTGTDLSSARLVYITPGALGQQIRNELSGNILSGDITIDEYSINKGTDGQLSDMLHLYNFHNDDGYTNTLANSDIVLRTPYRAENIEGVRNKLEYISFEDFKEIIDTWISTDINNNSSLSALIQDAVEAALSGVSPNGGSSGMFAWDEKTRTIGAGGCMVGRQWYTASNTGSGKSDGLYSVVVTLNSSGSVFCGVVSNATLGQAPTDTQCWIPIYQITDGKIATDYRGAFVVPAYD